jgi:multidrug efflux pump subunit AcrA (membrane-fusion protein)
MKVRLAAIALILVGVGAVAIVIIGPTFGPSSSSKYLTSTVTTGAVSAQSVATGTISASMVYGLKFGATADIVSTTATTSGSGGSTSNSTTTSLTWPVQTVKVTVGQRVTKGTTLATAESSAAQLALASAQATLASAQSKLTTDKGGPDSLTLARAKNQLNQSYNSYKQARASRTNTNQQNALKLAQAKAAVASASDPAALAKAQADLANTQLSVNSSNQQAAQQVTNASLSYASAKLQYQGKIAPASTATVQADQALVASAQATVNAAQAAVSAATLTAPADGLIIAVNVLPNVNAPSGYAIEESIGPMVANASFAESDIANLKVGQTASVSITGSSSTAVAGTLTQIVPVASSSSGGGSSVATYAVTVTLTSPPETVLAGMSATVTVTTASVDNVLRVPATALQGSANTGYSVLVMPGNGSTSSVSVTVGLVTTSMAEIKSGLTLGETVVTGTTASRTGTTTTGGGGVNVNSLTGGGGFPGGGFQR